MLAKKTSKNQITLPKAIVCHFPDIEYFDVREEEGRIVLVPVRPSHSDDVRKKLSEREPRWLDVSANVERLLDLSKLLLGLFLRSPDRDALLVALAVGATWSDLVAQLP